MQVTQGSEIIDSLFTSRDVNEIEDYLSGQPHINILKLTDSQGNNVLHQLAFEGHIDIIKLFIRKVALQMRKNQQSGRDGWASKEQDQKEFTLWINHRNHQGFTALLYASYSGHLNIIKHLVEEYHADFSIRTNTGLNQLHLAAQKNVIMPFLYFRGKVNLYQLDDLLSTPLHWAAYTNSEEVVTYILSECHLPHLLNSKDTEGNTALALAVSYGNTRVVRRLLIRGVDRYIRNDEGKSPLAIARESEFKTISRMLDEQFSVVDMLKFYCNIKVEYKPTGRKMLMPLLFMACLLVNVAVVNLLLVWTEDVVFYGEVVFMGVMFAYYLSLLIQRPRNQPKTMEHLLEEYTERTIKKVCFTCINRSPRRGYHCDVCGVCIQQYDHHCTWINNCVGKRNIARFIIFILMLVVSLAFIGTASLLATIALATHSPAQFGTFFTFRYNYTSELERYCLLGCFLVGELTSVFVVPVFLLCVMQIRNLLTNKTTFEKLRGLVIEANPIKSKYSSSRVSLRNCKVMCSDRRGGSFTSTTSRSSVSELMTSTRNLSEQQELDSHSHPHPHGESSHSHPHGESSHPHPYPHGESSHSHPHGESHPVK